FPIVQSVFLSLAFLPCLPCIPWFLPIFSAEGDRNDYFAVSITLAELIFTSCTGRSPEAVFTAPILSATCLLASSAVWPKTVYWRSRLAQRATQMKNCEPPEFGSFERAIESVPISCRRSLNSCLIW